jgi:ABC-type sugar transport system permease subunit
MIYVFNSFPIIWTLNDRNPGLSHDTTVTFMYKIAFRSADRDVGMGAAMSVLNLLIILVAVLVYLRTVRWRDEEESR